MAPIESKHQWADLLAGLNPIIGTLNLKKGADVSYVEIVDAVRDIRDADAYNLSNSDPHNAMIARVASVLHASLDDVALRHVLGELTSGKAYGAFCELAAYDWLARADIPFSPQVAMSPGDVVNKNGSTLDGRMTLANGKELYFDSKAFGFLVRLMKRLEERLQAEFPSQAVILEGDFDVSIESLQHLLEGREFSLLVQELRSNPVARRGSLEISLRKRTPFMVSHRTASVRGLAQANDEYLFRYASQYTRHAPFVLVLVIHPWFSGVDMHQNFAGYVDSFTREFIAPMFLGKHDAATLRENIPTGEIVKLLSGVIFLNVWPEGITEEIAPTVRILLNPGATHRLRCEDFAFLNETMGDKVRVEEVGRHRYILLLTLVGITIAGAALWWLIAR
jgi:hypothetical protein